jgi:hypothetical protein
VTKRELEALLKVMATGLRDDIEKRQAGKLNALANHAVDHRLFAYTVQKLVKEISSLKSEIKELKQQLGVDE